MPRTVPPVHPRSPATPRRPYRAPRRSGGALAVGVAVALLAVPVAADASSSSAHHPQRFETRPDLRPPGVRVLKTTDQATPGLTFVGPKRGPQKAQSGNMIFDSQGDLVYFDGSAGTKMDLRVQTLDGRPVLTWWEGKGFRGYGEGEGVIVDQQYREIGRVGTGNGIKADFHEFKLTDRGTALLLGYKRQKRDLRSVGGSKNGWIMEGIVQEVDVKTGKVVFDWRATRHVKLSESYHPVPKRRTVPFDFFHVNSVNLDGDGNYLVSARSTHTIYKLDRRTGKIIWRLGGKKPTFKHDRGTRTRWQHDVQRQADGTITIFDNNAHQAQTKLKARGLQIRVDEQAKRVSLVRSYRRGATVFSPNQGNMQTTDTGNRLISWGGTIPFITELSPGGKVVWEARFSRKPTETYRAYRHAWNAQPTTRPKVAARRSGSRTAVRASWNGATTVHAWRVVAGADDATLAPTGQSARRGFETLIVVPGHHARIAVEALDAAGNVLSRSASVAPTKSEYVRG
ncbi:MAG: arylsulfotransferase family protein [Solirubrobacteraceae bacterium]